MAETTNIDLTSSEVFADSDEEDQLMIDESGSSKEKGSHDDSIHVDEEEEESNDATNNSVVQDVDNDNTENNEDMGEDEENIEAEISDQTQSSSSVKAIQAVLSRAKPCSHSTQTRYQTRTRSCSLPSRQARYSSTETPFACDTKLSLLDLASKLAAADKKVNGRKSNEKKSAGKQAKPPPAGTKTMLAALKKKIQLLSAADEEAEKSTTVQLELPASLVNSHSLSNGSSHLKDNTAQSPDIKTGKHQVVKVDLSHGARDKIVVSSGSLSKGKFLKDEKLRSHRRNVANAQKLQAMQEQAKLRELECVKRLEEHRAKEKEKHAQAAAFHAKALEFYNDALRVMSCLHSDPKDDDILPLLPQVEGGGLPLWPLLASTTTKPVQDSAFTTQIQSVIADSPTPERSRRKRPHAFISTPTASTEDDIPDKDTNVNSGSLDVPEHIEESDENAIECLAVNYAIRGKIPKFAKRSFEAAKYAAQTGIRNIMAAEESRRQKEAQGFGGPPARLNPPQNKQFVNISPAPSKSSPVLIPVPVNLIPVQFTKLVPVSSQPTQLRPVGVATSHTGLPATTPSQSVKQKSPAQQSSELSSLAAKRRFLCPECDYTTDNRSHLRRHVVTVHSDVKPFKCYVCDKEFSRGEKCKYHMQREHPDVLYDARKTRSQYVKLAEDGVSWPLDVCPVVEENTDSTNSEETSADGTQETAPPPDMMKASAMLQDIVRTSLQGNTASTASPSPQRNTSSPQQSSAATCPQSFVCQHCSHVAKDIAQLQKHVAEMHSAIRRLRCGVCHYSTGRKQKMITHMKKHGELFCFHCDFSTMLRSVFYAHLRYCSTEAHAKVLTCPTCHRIYNTRKQLQTHMNDAHESAEIFFCDMCPYSATDFQEFEQHTEMHFSGQLDSQCMKCNDAFSKAEELLEHAKDCVGTPSGNFKIKCPQCTFNTNQVPLLQEHLMSHTKEHLIRCKMDGCDFSARWDSTIEQHMKFKHKIEPPKPKSDSAKVAKVSKPRTPPVVSGPLKLQPTMLQPSRGKNLASPTLQSPTIIQSPLNFSGVALSGMPISLPISAVPIFSSPIPLQPITMIQAPPRKILPVTKSPTNATQSATRTTNAVKSPNTVSALLTKASSPPAANPQPVYDERTGGIRGHGSGMFECPYCPERLPFKYRRSYEKHLYKHQKARKQVTTPLSAMKIQCPINYCRAMLDTNELVDEHLIEVHNVAAPTSKPLDLTNSAAADADRFTIINHPETVIVDSDDDEEEEHKRENQTAVTSTSLINGANGDIEFKLDLTGDDDDDDDEDDDEKEGGSNSVDCSSGENSGHDTVEEEEAETKSR